MAGPFDWLTQYLPGGGIGAEAATQAPSALPQPVAGSPTYTGPTASAGDVFGPAGLDYLRGLPSRGQVEEYNKGTTKAEDIEQRDAQAKLMGKAAEIQHANPQAMPDQLFKQLMMDQGSQDQLMKVPAGQHGKVLQEIMKEFQPTPPKFVHSGPGSVIGQEPTGKPGDEYRRVDQVPQSAAQQGLGRQPRIVANPVRNNFGEVIGTDHFLEGVGPNGQPTYRKLIDNGNGDLVPQDAPNSPPVGRVGANGQAVPAQQQGQGVATGPTQPGQLNLRGNAPGGQPTAPPPGGVNPPIAEQLPRKADMVDTFGIAANVGRKISGVTGQIDPEAAQPRLHNAQTMLEQLRAATTSLSGASARLKGEWTTKQALMPPENTMLWSASEGIDKLLQLHDWATERYNRASNELASPYSSNAGKKDAYKEQQSLESVLSALGSRDDLTAKRLELRAGKGGGGIQDVIQAIPRRSAIGKTVDEIKAAPGQVIDRVTGAGAGAPEKPVGDKEFEQRLPTLDIEGIDKLSQNLDKMTPAQRALFNAEIDRRVKSVGKLPGKVPPQRVPEGQPDRPQ